MYCKYRTVKVDTTVSDLVNKHKNEPYRKYKTFKVVSISFYISISTYLPDKTDPYRKDRTLKVDSTVSALVLPSVR